jgi:putative spermidine/putrescine transport system substrate-binding protein
MIYDADYWAITKGTTKLDAAYKFIQFASQPAPQGVFSTEITYGPTNLKAIGGLSPAIAAELPTAPANLKNSVANNTQFWVERGEELEQRFNAWAAK